ncbi:hypothetical protein ADK60_06520 [Streptomyces sp. XY431]|uniref:hypothetical protein n=1 Tax=Streptomyces sp. XY431 TaxID=1415562 RepID=UPI0006AF1E9B|nr:hypothetical protein [Streptomyces sp. XY431]KOV36701.1 hypothetical protein ADK60_06520 [Streptomyces sp. XY431]
MGFALGCLVTTAALWRLTLSSARQAARSAARAEAALSTAALSTAALKTGSTGTDDADADAPSVAKPAPVKPAATVGPDRPATAPKPDPKPEPKPDPEPEPKPVRPSAPAAKAAEKDLPRLRPATGPSDDRGPVPRRQPGERFHFSGQCESDEETEYEFPIEWPEGTAAVAQIEVATKGYLSIKPVTRTRDRIKSHSSLIFLGSFDKRQGVRTLLTRDFTHLCVESSGSGEWSVRLYSPDEIDELTGVMEGYGSTVLAVGPDTPVDCVAHVKSSSWSAVFVCACGRIPEAFEKCGCPVPPGLPRSPTLGAWESGEALRTLQLPRPGVLQLHTSKPSDPWRLEIRPYVPDPQDR